MRAKIIYPIAILLVLATGFNSCKEETYWNTEYAIIHKITVKSFDATPDYYTDNWDADGNADLYLRLDIDHYFNSSDVDWESPNIISNASPTGEYEFIISPPIIAGAHDDIRIYAYDYDVSTTDQQIGYLQYSPSVFLSIDIDHETRDTVQVEDSYNYGQFVVEIDVEYAHRKETN